MGLQLRGAPEKAVGNVLGPEVAHIVHMYIV